MRKSDIFLIFWLSFACPAFADQKVEITTYFPSPEGVAKVLRFAPSTQPAASDAGLMYYDQSSDLMMIANGSGPSGWNAIGGSSSLWTRNATSIYPMNPAWDVRSVNASSAVNGTLQIDGAFFRGNIQTDVRDAANLSTQVNLGLAAGGIRSTTEEAYDTIIGGYNRISLDGGVVVGGYENDASGHAGTVVGGQDNVCTYGNSGQTASGGYNNRASISSAYTRNYTVVSGGANNMAGGMLYGNYAVVSGGLNNAASGEFAVVNGGENNIASGNYSVLTGGQNCTASGNFSTVSGGENNTASGDYSAVTCGINNVASGNYSWAGGVAAKATRKGSFVWAGTWGGYSSPADDSFTIIAANGTYFNGTYSGFNQLNATIFDVAEYVDMPQNSSLAGGELASLAGERVADKATRAYDPRLLGVVSGNKTCSFFMGERTSALPGYKRVPISLAGPVYCRVNDQSGPVALGDAITSSDTPGEGMKAGDWGKIVGYAMQDEKFQDTHSKEIIVFVSSGYHMRADDFRKVEQRLESLDARVARLREQPRGKR